MPRQKLNKLPGERKVVLLKGYYAKKHTSYSDEVRAAIIIAAASGDTAYKVCRNSAMIAGRPLDFSSVASIIAEHWKDILDARKNWARYAAGLGMAVKVARIDRWNRRVEAIQDLLYTEGLDGSLHLASEAPNFMTLLIEERHTLEAIARETEGMTYDEEGDPEFKDMTDEELIGRIAKGLSSNIGLTVQIMNAGAPIEIASPRQRKSIEEELEDADGESVTE